MKCNAIDHRRYQASGAPSKTKNLTRRTQIQSGGLFGSFCPNKKNELVIENPTKSIYAEQSETKYPPQNTTEPIKKNAKTTGSLLFLPIR